MYNYNIQSYEYTELMELFDIILYPFRISFLFSQYIYIYFFHFLQFLSNQTEFHSNSFLDNQTLI